MSRHQQARLQTLLTAIADPRRRAILRLVQERELPAGEIAERFHTTRQAVSQHLRVLESAGLLELRREGAKRWYRTQPGTLMELRTFLEAFWDASLTTLKHHVEYERRRIRRRH